ncbi:MAG: DUF1848 domain-containing protein [Amedibacillus dolichus]|nr:MAG: DUF1848 domain-containing protein [Amedibacillus dolichus]
MILLASGRCDIVAFYSKWLLRRIEEGFVDVRNPYDPHQLSRIYLNEQSVDVLVFCTKNPLPILPHIKQIPFPMLFHVTLTPYHKEIEQLPSKKEILKAIQFLAKQIGKEHIVVRYDPIFLSDIYTLEYHKKAFQRLCEQLEGYVSTIIISFVDMYKNTKENIAKMSLQTMRPSDMLEIGKSFGEIAKKHHLHVQTCAEEIDLSMYGITQGACFERKQLEAIAKHSLSHISDKGVRSTCDCLATVDIGDYNCCAHDCLYCYANYDSKAIFQRMKCHDPNSTVLIGRIEDGDRIHERKEASIKQISLL